jgi:MFS family permease
VLLCTQGAMGLLALVLGLLVVTGYVQLWHVYVFAFLLGCAAAFDSPARQTFVAELVDDELLPNAVGLNSTSFNAARMIGPAIAGSLIAAVGTGWVFLLNAASFIAVLISLTILRTLPLRERPAQARGSLLEGFRYVLRRDDLKAVLLMLFLIGTFGLNFPIFIATMSVKVFHASAGAFGLLTSMMAAGSVIGALMVAARPRPGIRVLLIGALMFGLGGAAAAAMPNYASFGIALMVVGIAAQTVTTSTNSYVQTSTEHHMRGRVTAILLAIALGGTPVGAPIVGWIADTFGPRWAPHQASSPRLWRSSILRPATTRALTRARNDNVTPEFSPQCVISRISLVALPHKQLTKVKLFGTASMKPVHPANLPLCVLWNGSNKITL